tara:strand:+ start:262 stop:588 length:327 start_codon:yes stop_codon:yes gene_type:complete
MTITCYLPVFFGKVFPAYKTQFALINGLALGIFGFSSSIIGGIISDVWEKKTYMIKSLIVIAGNLLSTPLLAIAVFSNNFWLSVFSASLMPLVSGAYFAPPVTMMQNT